MILDEIVAHKKTELERLKGERSLRQLERQIGQVKPAGRFKSGLLSSTAVALIAEIKRASPSAGLIREDFDPVQIAETYERCGAAAVSVLTDERFFQGSLTILDEVRRHIELPVLRKDFVVDPYQIYEACLAGADAILLIVAILSDGELKAFLRLCNDLGLDALVETHTGAEVTRAMEAEAGIIGINNRDLKTFSVDLSTTLELVGRIPSSTVRVSESGIRTREDVKRLADAGVDAVLVGTAFMKAADIGAQVKALMGTY